MTAGDVIEFPNGEKARLPRLSPVVIDAIMEMLTQDHPRTRPPEKTAALLALIVELHRMGMPFPERQVVADALGCSIHMVDAALSQRLDEGHISLVVETTTGNVQQRGSSRRLRHYVPSKELRHLVDHAKKRA